MTQLKTLNQTYEELMNEIEKIEEWLFNNSSRIEIRQQIKDYELDLLESKAKLSQFIKDIIEQKEWLKDLLLYNLHGGTLKIVQELITEIDKILNKFRFCKSLK